MGSCLSFLLDPDSTDNTSSGGASKPRSPLVEVNDSRRLTQAIDMGNFHSKKGTKKADLPQDAPVAHHAAAVAAPSTLPTASSTNTATGGGEEVVDGEQTPLQFIFNMTGQNKPLDASDVTPATLHEATNEIRLIRKFAADYLAAVEGGGASSGIGDSAGFSMEDQPQDKSDESKEEEEDDYNDKNVRLALYDKQDFASFRKISYEKSPEIRDLIYEAIRPNALFEFDTKEELLQIIDVFKPVMITKGQCVVRQGEVGSEFYVVESGTLSVHVSFRGGGGGGGMGEPSEVRVGTYTKGNTFGELALIFGSPRAATITAMTDDCKVWSLEREAYRSVISQIRYAQHMEKNAFLKSCVVSGHAFTDLFDEYMIEDLTIATKVDVYEAGEVILRQGEIGDTFYIVKSGRVDTYRNRSGDGGEERVGSIDEKKTFGTTSLLKGDPNPYTYMAANRVTLFYLTRRDFEAIMGRFQDVIDGNTVARTIHTKEKDASRRTFTTTMSHEEKYRCELHDLEHFKLLGRGAFGKVTLVQTTRTKKVFALKAQSKHTIVSKRQQEHVMNELHITNDIDHPNIVRIHCAMQDDKYLYFLLDLLPGGDLWSHLKKTTRKGMGGFSEDVTKFYAASVLLAFEVLHQSLIAYRDLKPENIVLNKKGYGVLVDFGLAKEISGGQTYTFCGTPDYMAPEVMRRAGHNWAVDYWGLGVFIFELTHGSAPFHAKNEQVRMRKVLKGFESVKVPSTFSGGLSDLISNLFTIDQSKRLGRTQNGIYAIKNHRWFAGFDWEAFSDQTLQAPIVPDIPSDIKSIGRLRIGSSHLPDEDPPSCEWWPVISS